jgi:hypothetical protein
MRSASLGGSKSPFALWPHEPNGEGTDNTARCLPPPCPSSYDDPIVLEEVARHAFEVVKVPPKPGQSGVGFSLAASGHAPVMTPEDVGSRVLLHLLDMTAAYLGHRMVSSELVFEPQAYCTGADGWVGASGEISSDRCAGQVRLKAKAGDD